MAKYIDADRFRAEIEKTYKSKIQPWLSGVSATSAIYDYVLPLIDALQQEQIDEQPEYGYLSTEYVHGKKSRWNVGDILAYYLCTSDEEGEIVIGKIVNVEFDDKEGWFYTFEDGCGSDEQSLVEDEVYKKN